MTGHTAQVQRPSEALAQPTPPMNEVNQPNGPDWEVDRVEAGLDKHGEKEAQLANTPPLSQAQKKRGDKGKGIALSEAGRSDPSTATPGRFTSPDPLSFSTSLPYLPDPEILSEGQVQQRMPDGTPLFPAVPTPVNKTKNDNGSQVKLALQPVSVRRSSRLRKTKANLVSFLSGKKKTKPKKALAAGKREIEEALVAAGLTRCLDTQNVVTGETQSDEEAQIKDVCGVLPAMSAAPIPHPEPEDRSPLAGMTGEEGAPFPGLEDDSLDEDLDLDDFEDLFGEEAPPQA